MYLIIDAGSGDDIDFLYGAPGAWRELRASYQKPADISIHVRELLGDTPAKPAGLAVILGGSFTRVRAVATFINTLSLAWDVPVMRFDDRQGLERASLPKVFAAAIPGSYVRPVYSSQPRIGGVQ